MDMLRLTPLSPVFIPPALFKHDQLVPVPDLSPDSIFPSGEPVNALLSGARALHGPQSEARNYRCQPNIPSDAHHPRSKRRVLPK